MHPQALQDQMFFFLFAQELHRFCGKLNVKPHTNNFGCIVLFETSGNVSIGRYENLDNSRHCTEINISDECESWIIKFGRLGLHVKEKIYVLSL
jgi:hypothetical protein